MFVIETKCSTYIPISHFLLYFGFLSLLQIAVASSNNICRKDIIRFAILFRILCIFSLPCYEDDFYRYLWDGYVLNLGISPYNFAPEKFFEMENLSLEAMEILDQINNPQLPTVYGPVAILFFFVCYKILPFSMYALKGLLAIVDVVCLLLVKNKLEDRELILLSWSPLLIFETVVNMHFEVLGILFVIIALFKRRTSLVPILLVMTVGIRIFSILLVPFILRKDMRGWAIFICGLLVLYLPFICSSSNEFSSLFAFAELWEYNSSIFAIFNALLSVENAKILSGIIFIIFYTILLINSKSGKVPGEYVIGALLLLAPVLNPWYFIWVMYFSAINRTSWPWLLAFMLPISYWHTDKMYEHHVFIRIVEFMPVLVYFITQGVKTCHLKGKKLAL